MKKNGFTSFYKNSENPEQFLPTENKYALIEISTQARALDSFKEIIWTNSACIVRHIGDGILALSWKSKMNTIGGEVLAGINKAIDLAEEKYNGLVIYNQGDNFSAGANVGMIFMFAIEQEYEELDMAIRYFQKTVMRLRYSNIPVVVAPHGLALGGACEMSMHADATVAHAETYMGLVEMGVGVIPGGAGTKEFALRASDEMKEGDIRLNILRNRFLTVGQAKVATSAEEAFELGYLSREKDEVCVSRAHQLMRAKEVCLSLHHSGYSAPQERKDILVLGCEGLGIVYAGASSMKSGNYISEHDQLISEKLGFVMCGGDLSAPTKVSEQYLLDLERKAFLELCMQRKSLERMQSLIKSGKILRN
jgi:3-hydroxyacyl-CoA dehydrogenase